MFLNSLQRILITIIKVNWALEMKYTYIEEVRAVPTIGSIIAVVAVLLINIESIQVQRLAPNINSASPRPRIVLQSEGTF